MPKLIYDRDQLAAVVFDDQNEIGLIIEALAAYAEHGEGIGARLQAADLHRHLTNPAPA